MEEAAATYAYPLMLQGGPRHLILKTLGWVRARFARVLLLRRMRDPRPLSYPQIHVIFTFLRHLSRTAPNPTQPLLTRSLHCA